MNKQKTKRRCSWLLGLFMTVAMLCLPVLSLPVHAQEDESCANGHDYSGTDYRGNQVCAVCGQVTGTVRSVEGEESIVWNYDNHGHMEVMGVGTLPDAENANEMDWSPYCYYVESLTIGDSISAVGDYNFCNFNILKSVHLGSLVKRIGANAFTNDPIKEITGGENLEQIETFAFYNVTFDKLYLYPSIQEIGQYAFESSKASKLIFVGNPKDVNFESAFASDVTIQFGCTADISDGDLDVLKQKTHVSVAIDETNRVHNYDENGKCKFCGYCRTYIETGVHTEAAEGGYSDFGGDGHGWSCPICGSWESQDHDFPDGAKTCTKCDACKIRVETGMHNAADENGKPLATCIDCGQENPQKCGDKIYWNVAENGTLYLVGEGSTDVYNGINMPWRYLGANIKAIDADEAITRIEIWTFGDCYNLESVNLPGATYIGVGAFSNAQALKEITLPNVTEIADTAFFDCIALETVTLPKVEKLGKDVFTGCIALKELKISCNEVEVFENQTYASEVKLTVLHTYENGVCKYCDICKSLAETGAHDYEGQPYIQVEKEHYRTCKDCGNESLKEACAGGVDTCVAGAICETCNEEYGGALGHSYGPAVFDWAEDGSSCSISFTCGRTGCEGKIEGDCTVTDAVKIPATCSKKGTTTYTATALINGGEYTDSIDLEDIPATEEHNYVAKIKNDLSDQKVSDATCEAPAVYKKYCTVCNKLDDETFEVGAALGHSYGPAAFTWVADGSSCSATFFCNRYGCTEKITSNCVITSAVKTPATYTDMGTTRYTAKAAYNGQTYKSTKDVADIAKLTLGKVSGLSVAEQAATEVTLKWNRLTGATGYILEKKDGTTWTRVAKIAGGDVVTYKVTGLATGNTYSFRIRGYAYENGKTANGTNSATLTVATKLPAITGVKVAGSTVNAIRLTWAKNEAVEGYQIEQLMADGSWKMIKKIVGADTLEYRIGNLTAGTGYKFRIRGYNTVPVKTYSDYTNVVTCTKLPAMTNVKVAGRSTNAVRLSWDKNEAAEGYQIEKKVNGVWKLYKKITTADTLEYRITNLTSATAYDFRVRAYKVVDGCVSYSDYVTLNTTTK